MNSAIIKNTLRKVWKTKGRFLAITAIIAIGSGFFTGVKVTGPSMKATATQYYEETNLMDYRFVSTVGFEQSDIDNINSLDGVVCTEPGYTADLFYKYNGRFDSIVRVYSYNEANIINKPTLVSGRMPTGDNECVIDDEMVDVFPVGSTISLGSDEDASVSDYLKNDEFTVVGTVDWSMYINFERGSTTLGNGEINAFMLVNDEAFSIDVYTVAYVKCREFGDIDPFSEEYENISEEKSLYFDGQMETLALNKSEALYQDAVNDPEFVQARLDYEQGLAAYEEAYSEYETQISELEKYINDANLQITEYTTLVNNATAEYETALAEYNSSNTALEESEAELLLREENANADEQELERKANSLGQIDGAPILNDYWLKVAQTPYPEALADIIAIAQADFDTGVMNLSVAIESFATASVDEKEQANEMIDTLIAHFEDDLADEQERIDAERSDIAAKRSENELKAVILAETKLELDASKLEIDTNQATLDGYVEQVSVAQGEIEAVTLEADAQFGEQKKLLDDAKVEIDNAYEEIEEATLGVEFYCFGRESNTGYSDFGTNADRVDSIAKIFPIFFIIVAILVCLTTMARMIEEERVEIGTLKALGYSRGAILAQYIAYAVCASVLGVAIGLSIGVSIIPKVIYIAYLLMYILPELQLEFPTAYVIGCTVVSLLCTVATVLISCSKALREVPASLMRPKAPKNGKRVLLEKVGFVWDYLSFNAKVTARNVFRFKSRVFMTVIGICGCTALLLAGFTLKYAISAVVDKQFVEIFKYDAFIYHDDNVEIDKLNAVLDTNENISEYTNALQKSFEISANGNTYDGYVVVPEDANALKSFINLRDSENGKAVNITGGGAVINEKLAQILEVEIGDEIEVGEKKTKVKVAAIAENYTNNYVYMSKAMYSTLFGEEKTNVIFANLTKSADEDLLFGQIGDALADEDGAVSIAFTKDSGQSFRDLVDTLDYIVIVVIVSSGALAFVVLYNLNNINIVERMRELATLKVLGFRDGEISAYIYRETTITAILGALLGLFVGTFFTKFVVLTAEVDVVMFARDIPLYCYLLALAVTLMFVALVDIIMYIKLKKIDMAASMKAVE